MAANGDLIVITGEGTLSVHPNSATGSGTFTHKDSGGNVLGSGTWTATQLLSFKDFGAGPGFPEGFTGGHAVIGVHLSPSEGGDGVDGILIVDCNLGTSPPGLEEGVRLALTGINFNEKVSGNNIFIRQ